VIAIQGDNGTGKSCLSRLAMGLYEPQIGQVRLFGRSPGSQGHIPRLGFVGSLPQVDGDLPLPPDLPVDLFRRVVIDALFESGADVEWAGKVAMDLQLDATDVRGKRFGQLSKGWHLRFQWWAALAKPVSLLMLDEPFDGLSIKIKPTVFRLLREVIDRHGAAVFLVTHHLSEAFKSGAERFFVIEDQQLREVLPGEFRVSYLVDGEEQLNSRRTLSGKELFELAESASVSHCQSSFGLSAHRVARGEA